MTTLQNPTKQKLSHKQQAALLMILAAPSISEGCRTARINRDTWYSWYAIPEFRKEFRRQRAVAIDEALDALKSALADAVGTLRGLLKATGRRGESTRLKASVVVLENVLKSVQMEQLEERLEALERRLTR